MFVSKMPLRFMRSMISCLYDVLAEHMTPNISFIWCNHSAKYYVRKLPT